MDVIIAQSAPGSALAYKIEFVNGQMVLSLGGAIAEGSLSVNLNISAKAVLDAAAKALGDGAIVKGAETIIEAGLGIPQA